MFNLIVSGVSWEPHRDTVSAGRVLEHTDPLVAQRFCPAGVLDVGAVTALPTIFMVEGRGEELARVGTINRLRRAGNEFHLEYTVDPAIAPIPNRQLRELMGRLDIHDFEFSRTHWAIKDVDLHLELLRARPTASRVPSVFNFSEAPVTRGLVSVMMPFDAGSTPVYVAIQQAVAAVGGACQRADDFWLHAQLMQDVVTLICNAQVVVCDLSGKNPNVFYEAGIAHAIGKEVILLTQHMEDVPFDLRHLRCIVYHNNNEGRLAMGAALQARLATLLAR